MTYNVLNYGDACQGPNSTMRNYLKNIISYTQPDILGLVKMSTIKRFPSDFNGNLPIDFCDSMVQNVLNPAGNVSYNYCLYTNEARGGDMNVLFYNKNKLVNIYTKVLTVNVTDFDLYKFYYKDPNLAISLDTTFLYVVLFHTQSGSDATIRNAQLSSTYNAIKGRFTSLPNMIMMGDFNTRNSNEVCYNQLVNNIDTNFKFYDPPFSIEGTFTYPANWQANSIFKSYFTTSTRADLVHPNSCGTDGGGKDWYDHILLSPWMVNGKNYISYIPHSYSTIGNDGKRQGLSVNDSSSTSKNISAPPAVINSIFQLSNKYPVMCNVLVKSNISGVSPSDPEKTNASVSELLINEADINFTNPSGNSLQILLDDKLLNKKIEILICDINGKHLRSIKTFNSEQLTFLIDISSLPKGFYFVTFNVYDENISFIKKLVKLDQ
ncbi:MAG: T9SS type A sorting domain-containing protein [Bacteroidota bacterium]